MTDRRDFFISFNSADLAYAQAIDAALRTAGFTTYYHPRDLKPGGNIPMWMGAALANSTQTLALYSPNYVAESAVYSQAEIHAAWWQDPLGASRKLIPVMLAETSMLPLSAPISYIDVKGLDPQAAAQTVANALLPWPGNAIEARTYDGKQIDFRQQKSGGFWPLLDAMRLRPGSGHLEIPNLFEYVFPTASIIDIAQQQKFILYGGFTPATVLNLSVLEMEAAQLTFKRDSAHHIAASIIAQPGGFSAYTILARPGQGKTIALAQIVARLCREPGLVTFWRLDQHDLPPLDRQTELDALYDAFRKAGAMPRKVTFVIDNISNNEEAGCLFRFYSKAKAFSDAIGASVSIVTATIDDEVTLASASENLVQLMLTPAEEERVFHALTEAPPIVAYKRFDTYADMLLRHPRKRDYENDVPSFIEYVLKNSTPAPQFRESWFSDIQQESDAAQRAIAFLAASQIFGLAVPHRLTSAALANEGIRGDANAIARLSHRISRVKGDWPGFALTSGYRAQIVLRSLGKLDKDFILATFRETMRSSIEFAEANTQAWVVQEVEYIRHIFQRLTKMQFYPIPEVKNEDRLDIADALIADFGSRIIDILHRAADERLYAQWAGTLCMLRSFRMRDKSLAVEVRRLCERAVGDDGAHIRDPKTLTMVLRAARQLAKVYGNGGDILNLTDKIVAFSNFERVLTAQVAVSSPDTELRCNALLHAYVLFERARWGNKSEPGPEGKKRIGALYAHADRQFRGKELHLDVGNLLQWADVVPVETEYNRRMKAQLLKSAEIELRRRPHRAAWAKDFNKARDSFERTFGRVESVLEPKPPQAASNGT
ncbi:MAG: toll/interleukin-1 receptor domain-containing protein [Alphaproteobacteria bacterium]|nr:toll/interleukin-1 receptor domain-containing protein [Alphaproteobacteria bacterium]